MSDEESVEMTFTSVADVATAVELPQIPIETGSLPTDAIVLVRTVNPDGTRTRHVVVSPNIGTEDILGALHFALLNETASYNALKVAELLTEEDDCE